MSKRNRRGTAKTLNSLLHSSSGPSAPEIVNHQPADVHTPAEQNLESLHVPVETTSANKNCSSRRNVPRRQRSKGASQTSGPSAPETVDHQLADVHTPANLPEDTTHVNRNCSSYKKVPRRKRSKGTLQNCAEENITDRNKETDGSENKPLNKDDKKPRPRTRERRKSKRTSDESESEVIPQHIVCCHGQSRRSNIQKGKLGSEKFELYLESIWKRHPEDSKNLFTYLDSLWFSLYSKRSYRAKVLNWITKRKIFSKKYVFVPIVMWGHWSLLILCHLGESLQSKTRSPCMLLLDSLRMANPERLEPGIRRFVLDIFDVEQRPETKDQIRKIPLKVPKVPQQTNDEDCGNFVLYYIKLFLEKAPANVSISKDYPNFMTEDWFTPEELACFYQELQSTTENAPDSDECLLLDDGDVVFLDHIP